MLKKVKENIYRKLVFKFSNFDRLGISNYFIKGSGIEIGGLNYPLPVGPGVKVKYLDRISADDHMAVLDEFERKELVNVDIIDDGETMATVADASQDFVIANHFIEHCQDVVTCIKNMVRVLKPGGRIFMAIPDKRYTFDVSRTITPIEHFIKDYEQGPSWSEEDHYIDFVKNTDHGEGKSEVEIRQVIEQLKKKNFSIHFHVWDHQAMIDMFCMLKKYFGFKYEIEVAISAKAGDNESIFILRKYND